MKIRIGFFILAAMVCISLAAFKPAFSGVPLSDAIKKGMVDVKIHGIDMNDFADRETMNNENLEVELTNKTAGELNIILPSGQIFVASEDPFQNMLIPQTQQMFVRAGSSRKFPVAGKCIQLHDMGPGEATMYTVGAMADGNLGKLAKYVDEKNLKNNPAVQQACWVISDNNPIWYVDENPELMKYVSLLTGKPVAERPKDMGGYYPPPIRSWTLKGQVDYALNEPSKVTLQITDSAGTVVKKFMDEMPKPKGKHWTKYTLTWKEGKYKMTLLVNGKVKSENEFLLKGESN